MELKFKMGKKFTTNVPKPEQQNSKNTHHLRSQMFDPAKACGKAIIVRNDHARIQTLKVQYDQRIRIEP